MIMKERKQHSPNELDRHKKFQFGTNPDEELAFEKRLIIQERKERENTRLKQVLGMQGVDGGRCWDREIDRGFMY
jgi:hypothetical protein